MHGPVGLLLPKQLLSSNQRSYIVRQHVQFVYLLSIGLIIIFNQTQLAMSSRRNFIQQLTAATGAFTFLPFTNNAFANEAESRYTQFRALDDVDAMTDEDFWGWVKEQYTVSPNLLNLNNGGVSPQPKVVQDAHIRFYQYANEGPTY